MLPKHAQASKITAGRQLNGEEEHVNEIKHKNLDERFHRSNSSDKTVIASSTNMQKVLVEHVVINEFCDRIGGRWYRQGTRRTEHA